MTHSTVKINTMITQRNHAKIPVKDERASMSSYAFLTTSTTHTAFGISLSILWPNVFKVKANGEIIFRISFIRKETYTNCYIFFSRRCRGAVIKQEQKTNSDTSDTFKQNDHHKSQKNVNTKEPSYKQNTLQNSNNIQTHSGADPQCSYL